MLHVFLFNPIYGFILSLMSFNSEHCYDKLIEKKF